MTPPVQEPMPARSGGRWLLLLPLIVFATVGPLLYFGLARNPAELPSTLVGREAPEFQLAPLPGRDDRGFSRVDLGKRPMLVNVFASWCEPCRQEHPVLTQLAKEGVIIQGINYKDEPEKARAFLAQMGDPYARIGADRQGRVSLDWGVYGVPETFVVDREGRILFRQAGPIMPRDLDRVIRPMLAKLAQ